MDSCDRSTCTSRPCQSAGLAFLETVNYVVGGTTANQFYIPMTHYYTTPRRQRQHWSDSTQIYNRYLIGSTKTSSLNYEKTKSLFFANRKHLKSYSNINITINNQKIQRGKSIKYLGITLSEDLSWHDHIDNLITKIGLLRRAKSCLPLEVSRLRRHNLGRQEQLGINGQTNTKCSSTLLGNWSSETT